MLSLTTPDYASPAWEQLSIELRGEVRGWLDAFRSRPERGITRWLHEVGESMGASYSTARRNYDALKSSGDWTVLVDQRKAGALVVPIDGTAAPAFRAALVTLVENYQRNNSAAFRELKRRWLQRQLAIPGYEEWPGWPAIPAGWHKRNLARIV